MELCKATTHLQNPSIHKDKNYFLFGLNIPYKKGIESITRNTAISQENMLMYIIDLFLEYTSHKK